MPSAPHPPAAAATRSTPTPPNPAPDPALSRAIAQYQRGELQAAEAALRQHLAQQPGSWTGLGLQAVLAAQTGRPALAERLWLQLVAREPGWVDGHVNLGLMYRGTGRLDSAEQHLRQALHAAPRHPGAWHNLGLVLMDRERPQDALAAFEQVLALPASVAEQAQAWFCIGSVWQGLLDFARAGQAWQRALALQPGHPAALSNHLFCLHLQPGLDLAHRSAEARRLAPQLMPAAGAAAPTDPTGPTAASPTAAGARPRVPATPADPATATAPRPLRIGLVSGDLRAHPVGFFLLPLLQPLRRVDPGLQLHAYANQPEHDDTSARLQAACTGWQRVDLLSDEALAARIQADRIDLLIDLAGHSARNRLGVFARRAAPRQLGWLGWFATTGLPTMDAVLADPVCVPTAEISTFSERVIHLPHTRLCFAPPADAPPVAPPPCLGRPRFTFGSFQDLGKLNDPVLRLWARILAAAPHTRLRIQSARLKHPAVRQGFIQRLLAAGLPAERLELLGAVSRAEYLAAHAEVDVLLDSFPYPGGTTTCEALWMGVPTLTLTTPGMLGRQGEALLKAAELPRWVADSEDAYLAMALRCASPQAGVRAGLAELRQGLRAHLPRTPLFDGARFARDWARAVRQAAGPG